MVAETHAAPAVSEPAEDLSWLSTAPRGTVWISPDESGAYVAGSEQPYLILLPDLICECKAAQFGNTSCFHVRQVRQAMEERERLKRVGEARERIKCGVCPVCGADAVSFLSFTPERGFLMEARCWESLADEPTCTYRRVMG